MIFFKKIFRSPAFHFKHPHYFSRFLTSTPSKSLKVFPTGSFVDLRRNGGYYLDKTHFIPEIENLNYPAILSLRPHCFGKSLFLSALSSYYDINNRGEKFEQLFGDLYIGKNPTPLATSFNVLHFDFSELYNRTDSETFEIKFHKFLNESMLKFKEKYYNYGFLPYFDGNDLWRALTYFSELLKTSRKVFVNLSDHYSLSL
jgi:hypothetical protein